MTSKQNIKPAKNSNKKFHLNSFEFKAMGCPCAIRLYAEDASQASQLIHLAVQEVLRLEKKYSRYLSSNLMSEINAAAQQGASVEIDSETSSLLDFAHNCYQQSDGLFDISSGVLREVWDFSSFNKARISTLNEIKKPSSKSIKNILNRIGWVHVSYNKNKLSFAKKNMQLDFGGIVKEYAVDRAVYILREAGVKSALVDLGGDIAVTGPHMDQQPWRVHIRHPRKIGAHFACFELFQGGLASSGDYERFITIDNKRYSHLLSPKTGWPVKGLSAVTVQAQRCVLAGSLATIAMLKEQQGVDWLEGLNVSHAWMDHQQQIGGDKKVLMASS